MPTSLKRRAHASLRACTVLALVSCMALANHSVLASLEESSPRSLGNVTEVTLDGVRLVALSEEGFWLGQSASPPSFGRFVPTPAPLLDVALAGEHLYAIDAEGSLVRFGTAGDFASKPVLVRASVNRRYDTLARMDDFLVAADVEGTVTTLALPLRHLHESMHHHDSEGSHEEVLEEKGAQAVGGRILDIASSLRRIFVLLDTRELVLIDASSPAKLRRQRVVTLDADYSALAVNGERVFLTGPAGLVQVDLDTPTRARLVHDRPDLAGRSLVMAGRALYMVTMGGSVAALADESLEAITHDVTVGNFFFDPEILDVAVGDTVRWTNSAGLHNTESCNGVSDPPVCGGGVAVENWNSGAPALPPWEFEKTFTLEGTNPYFCRQHQLTMGGTITVSSSAVAPPGVPDGALGSPMLVSKLSAPDSLEVSFDTATCDGDADHQIVWGFGSQLPSAPGSSLGLSGSECALGGSPYVWNASPDPTSDPSSLVWFLVLATDGVDVEGSWGTDSAGTERGGPGADGSSGQCGVVTKDLSNSCGV